ncbi:sporulation protein [Peribacillus sp. SCS-155]|uniref:sporulation protein n=1 Tax=Peribacillus sedimenti TaxID=3115297 RepID=UPI0039060D8F
MEQSLAYLREIMAGRADDTNMAGREIYKLLTNKQYTTEAAFVRDLTQEEAKYLNSILIQAIEYSNQEKDEKRARHLNEIYEILMI